MRRHLLVLAFLGLLVLPACGDDAVTSLAVGFDVAPGDVDFGPVWLGEVAERRIELTNAGQAPVDVELRGIALPFEGPSRVTVPVGEATVVALAFRPTVATSTRAVVSLVAAGLPPRQIELAGEGAAATLDVAPALEFGGVRVGETLERVLPIRNEAPLSTPDFRYRVEGPDAEAFAVTTQLRSIGPGVTAELAIAFAAGTLREYRATLVAASCGWCEAVSVQLSGRGIDRQIEAVPERLEFPTVAPGRSSTIVLGVRNRGEYPAALAGLRLEGQGYSAAGGVLPAVLGQDEHLELPITFAPLAPGDYDAAILLEDEAGEAVLAVPLHGHSGGPRLTAAPLAIDLGRLPRGFRAGTRLVVRNGGEDSPIALGAATIEGDPGWSVAVPTLPAPLEGSGLPLQVNFAAEAVGPSEATLVLWPSDPAWSELRVPLAAVVADDVCDIRATPSPLRFGAVSRVMHNRRLHLRNVGPGPCIIWDLALDPAGAPGFALEPTEVMRDLQPGESWNPLVVYWGDGPMPDIQTTTIRYRTSNVGTPERTVAASAWPHMYGLSFLHTGIFVFPTPVGDVARAPVRLESTDWMDFRIVSAGISVGSDPALSISAAPPLPLEFRRQSPAFELSFAPTAPGQHWGELEFEIEALVGSPPTTVPFLQPVIYELSPVAVSRNE